MTRYSPSTPAKFAFDRHPFRFLLANSSILLPFTTAVNRPWATTRCPIRLLVVLALIATNPAAYGQVVPGLGQPQAGDETQQQESDLHSLYYSAHLPIDRRLAQDLDQAQRLFAANRYSEGLPLVDRVLEASEDTFELADRRESLAVASSLKTAAKRLLAGLPPDGVAALELDQGVKARRELADAVTSGSLEGVARVARRYPVTEAATEAALMLAQSELDIGRIGSAASIYRELSTWPKARTRHAALLAVRLVWCHASLGDETEFKAAITALQRLNSPSERRALEQLIGPEGLEAWLAQLPRQRSPDSLSSGKEGWLIEGHNAFRNPVYSNGGAPHVWPAWEARTVKERHVDARLKSRVDWQQRRGTSWGLVASPIAVGNYVIVRTPTNLVAIDWRSGRRVWETRPEVLDDDINPLNLSYQIDNQQAAVSFDAVDQRLWLDLVYGAISSDGERVFAIRNLDSVHMRGNAPFGMRAFGRLDEELEDLGNTLAAYDLRTEGKRLWKLDGETNPQLAGCFFLGPPLAIGNSLYVIAEYANSIHLIELDSRDGRLVWKQPLANLERSVLFDAGRRLAGATPTYSHGLVICPTGAGSVVAVDPADRSLKWAFRFAVDPSVATGNNAGWRQAFGVYQPTLTNRWQRNRAVVSGNSVLVTAPECELLYCLEVLTGEKRWSVGRGQHQYLAGVAGDRVVLVGQQQVSLLTLASGDPAIPNAPINIPNDETVAGIGVVTGNRLLLPLSGNRIGVVDLAAGEFQQTLSLREGHSVGNLAFHRGTLLSQSATSLTRFDQISTLLDQLANNQGESAESYRIQGEIAWGEGDLDRAIELFRRAYQLTPNEPQVRRRFSSALFAGLRNDYQRYRNDDQLLQELLDETAQKIELLRFHISGSLAAGDPAAAFAYASKLYEIDREGMVDLDDGSRQVQSERWFAARLAEIWHRADDSVRTRIAEKLIEFESDTDAPGKANQLSRFVSYFGGIPAARRARLRLAGEWMAADRIREAELLLLQTDPAERTSQFDGVALGELLPISDELLADDQPRRLAGDAGTMIANWPDGKVEVKVESGRAAAAPTPNFNSGVQTRSRNSIRLKVEPTWSGTPWSGPASLAVSYGSPTQLLGWNRLGEVTHGVPLRFAMLQNPNSNSQVRCFRFGHFAVIAAGYDVAAIDLRSAALRQSPTMWASDTENNSRSRTIRAMQNRGSAIFLPEQPSTSPGPAGELCTASPLGVVIRSDGVLRCFDPVDGDLLWQRRGMPSSGATFGDSQYVFLIAEGESTGIALSMLDGSIEGEWNNPAGKSLGTCGRHVVTSQFQQGQRTIRVVDVLTGETKLERTYSSTAKLDLLPPTTMACMEPSGELDVLDLINGRIQFSQTLEPERGLEGIHLLASNGLLILATNTRTAPQHNAAGNEALENAPVVTGRVYALDAKSGSPRWERPATINGQGLWQLQPTASPVLMFISNKEDRTTNQQNAATRLLCLDKRTGRSLLREDNLHEPENGPWLMRIDHNGDPTVSIDLLHTLVTLRFTTNPRPPEPVALADVEGIRKSRGTGLIGIAGRIFEKTFQLTPPPPAIDDDD